MLPPLQRLALRPRAEEGRGAAARTGLPAQSQVPLLNVRVDADSATRAFSLRNEFALFKAGAVFTCVDQYVRINGEKDSLAYSALRAFASRPFASRADGIEKLKHGGFNHTELIDSNDLAIDTGYGNVRFRLLAAANDEISKGSLSRFLDKLIVRTTRDDRMRESVRSAVRSTKGDINSVLDMLFQELFLTLYAASIGVGPFVYACRLSFSTDDGEALPRVIYLMEPGNRDLYKACMPPLDKIVPDTRLGVLLFSNLKKASEAGMLVLDLKPRNIVVFESPGGTRYDDVKLIDFDPRFTTVLHAASESTPGSSKLVNDILYVNCMMFAFAVTSMYQEQLRCMLPVLRNVRNYLQQAALDSSGLRHSYLRSVVDARMFQTKTSFSRVDAACPSSASTLLDTQAIDAIIDTIMNQILAYALRNVDLSLPITPPRTPLLFEKTKFRPDLPLVPQMLENFFQWYAEASGEPPDRLLALRRDRDENEGSSTRTPLDD